MGFLLSPLMADLVMQDLEEMTTSKLSLQALFLFFRYVDDILFAAPQHLFEILDSFNSMHESLRFTLKIGINKISFLDTVIIVRNNTIIFYLYKKPTLSGRYLNFNSHHSLRQKKGIVYNLVDKAVRLSYPTFHSKNLKEIIEHLLDNGYPLDFIFYSYKPFYHLSFCRA